MAILLRLSELYLEVPGAPQYARPLSDVAVSGWTPSVGSMVAPVLDEATADDADYITSAGSGGETATVLLGPLNRPVPGTSYLRVRVKRG